MEKICVAVRVRPPSSSQSTQWKIVDNTISLCSAFGTPVSGQTYTFDHVFGEGDQNAIIYELHTKELITAALRGFNGTVFAYGQTSSGKTFTMRGSESDPGLISLAVHEVFTDIHKIVDREFLIRVSYMEIYNEEINDLLSPGNLKLQIHENLEKGIFVAGLREEIVNTPKQVFELLEFGEAHRHVGQTNMNVYSSRSHTIFRMVIESKDRHVQPANSCSLDAVRVSVLNLVDLAGSERVAKTRAGGVRLKEGTHINKSLMTLGNVIKKLSDGAAKQGGHIPYRDSKLTRILQPALGGNAKTAIICTIAPDEVHVDETRGTLQFASRAKRITTCAQINEILTDAALLKRQQREIEELRKKLQGSQSEVLEQEILCLRNDLLKYELEREKLALELQEERKAQLEREQRIKEQELKIENLSSLVITSSVDDPLNKDVRKHFERGPSLITVRRERHQSPANFESLSGKSGEIDMNGSTRQEDIPLPSDFGNVADEDLWFTLNDGQSLAEPEFLFNTPSRWTSSVGSTREMKSSSIHNALMRSMVKSERYKSQLEDAQKENLELQNQLKEHINFQKQLQDELSEMEREVSITKTMTETMTEFWEVLKQAKIFASATFQNIVAAEKSQVHSVTMCAEDMRNTYIHNLHQKIKELEVELLNHKQENSQLRMQYEQLQFSGATTTVSEVMESRNKDREPPIITNHETHELSFSPVQESGGPLVLSDCKVNRHCNKLASLDGQLSNDRAAVIAGCIDCEQRLVFKMPKVDTWTGNLQKDFNFRVPDGNWLAHHSRGVRSTCQKNKEEFRHRWKIIQEDMHLTTSDYTSETKENNVVNKRKPSSRDDINFQDREALIDTLLISREYIKDLEKQVLLANLEKDRTFSVLKQHLYEHEESMVAMKLEKLKFAKELKNIMEAIAIQDSFVTSICRGIEEFEKGMDLESANFRKQIISN